MVVEVRGTGSSEKHGRGRPIECDHGLDQGAEVSQVQGGRELTDSNVASEDSFSSDSTSEGVIFKAHSVESQVYSKILGSVSFSVSFMLLFTLPVDRAGSMVFQNISVFICEPHSVVSRLPCSLDVFHSNTTTTASLKTFLTAEPPGGLCTAFPPRALIGASEAAVFSQ